MVNNLTTVNLIFSTRWDLGLPQRYDHLRAAINRNLDCKNFYLIRRSVIERLL